VLNRPVCLRAYSLERSPLQYIYSIATSPPLNVAIILMSFEDSISKHSFTNSWIQPSNSTYIRQNVNPRKELLRQCK
ncbi:hypothetical protein VN97_g10741, partial [Penicillium thymicola]